MNIWARVGAYGLDSYENDCDSTLATGHADCGLRVECAAWRWELWERHSNGGLCCSATKELLSRCLVRVRVRVSVRVRVGVRVGYRGGWLVLRGLVSLCLLCKI